MVDGSPEDATADATPNPAHRRERGDGGRGERGAAGAGPGGRRAGRPKGRTGHKAPKRPVGRLLHWPPGPLRLTSRCWCDKIHNEGSHRRHSASPPIVHGATKARSFSQRPGFAIPGSPSTRLSPHQMRLTQQNLVILLRSPDPNKYCPLLPCAGLLMRFPVWQWVRVLHRILSNA